jgi:hypothetical protein
MRLTILALTTSLSLIACQKQADTAPPQSNATDANAAAPSGTALASLNETSWTFTDKDKNNVEESVDANGNYIAQTTAGKHLDHGTAVMKDGKGCFTSAMTKDGEICWTDPMLAIGQSGPSTSDKGETLTLTRVAYKPLSM